MERESDMKRWSKPLWRVVVALWAVFCVYAGWDAMGDPGLPAWVPALWFFAAFMIAVSFGIDVVYSKRIQKDSEK